MKAKSILLVDDDESIRESIARDLEKQGYVVYTALNGEEGIWKFEANPTDLVITDLIREEGASIPFSVDGIQLSKVIKKIKPSTEIIIHTGHPSTPSAIDALKLGACDYLLKPCSRRELLKSVADCFKHKKNYNPMTRNSAEFSLKLQESGLTSRELEVCYLIKKGKSNAEISFELFISLNTTKNHIKRIHKKLGVSNRGQLVFLLNQEL